jgi:hypothetical protein
MGQTHVVTGSPNPLEFIVSMALQAASNAIAQELLSGSPVRDRWGGAFEIAGFVGGKARKIENVLFLYWLARRNQEKGEIRILQNPIIFKPGYFGNLMLLRFAFIEQAKEALRVSREGVYLIPEFIGHAPDNLESIKPPDFSYDFLASNVFLEDSGSITGAYCRLDYFGSGEKPVAISEVESAQHDFIISQDYFMKLGKGGIQH